MTKKNLNPSPARKSKAISKRKASSNIPDRFPIIGIGSSAGGIEALTLLLSNLPQKPNAAFVIIQHLSPNKPSLTAEILSRRCKLPISKAQNGLFIENNHVYVIPPKTYLKISKGKLALTPRPVQTNPHLPIDIFFISLATEAKERAVGIVLSGTGSDGALGLVAIKAEDGITYAQEPLSAKYSGMPEAAIHTGAVDSILDPKEMAQEIIRISRHPYISSSMSDSPSTSLTLSSKPESQESALFKIFSLLNYTIHVDFTQYKRATLLRRIARRQLVLKIKDLGHYAEYLENHPEENNALFTDILIHVTSFFRDPDVFEKLQSKILPNYLVTHEPNQPLRVWVPGCSTGEEAYSLAILFMEYFEKRGTIDQVQIFASDISENAIKKARSGFYSENAVTGLSKQRLDKYFKKVTNGYVVIKRIRNLCVFSKQDITSDPPFAKIDLISCRNLLIYFDEELQKRIFPLFHYSLKKNGILILGKSENNGKQPKLFSPIDKTKRIFAKVDSNKPAHAIFMSKKSLARTTKTRYPPFRQLIHQPPLAQKDLEKLILREYSPPSIVVNEAMDILQVLGSVNRFIEFSSGQASLNLMRVAKPDLALTLRKLISEAKEKGVSVRKAGLQLRDAKDDQFFEIRVLPLNSSLALTQRHYAIIFEPKLPPRIHLGQKSNLPKNLKKSTSRKDYNSELEQSKVREGNLMALNEAYEIGQEELTASNEELQTVNEELQSTNEEMETAREELQSSNEELSTVNEELQTRNDQLTQMGADLEGLLASSNVPMILIGPDLRIRHFNPQTQKIFKFISSDIGRSINDLKIELLEINIGDIVNFVLKNNKGTEVETQDRAGHWYRLQAKPYSKNSENIEGAVITLIDIQYAKAALETAKIASKQLIAAKADTLRILEMNPIPILILKSDMRIIFANPAFYQMFSLSIKSTLNRTLADIGDGMLHIPEIIAKVNGVMDKDAEFGGLEIQVTTPLDETKTIVLHARKIQLPGSGIETTLVAIEDVSAVKSAETGRTNALKLLQEVSSRAPGMLYQFQMRPDGSTCFPYSSSGIKEVYGVSPEDVAEDASKIFSILHPDDLPIVRESLKTSARLLKPWKLQYRVKHKNGDIRWLDGSSIPSKQSDGGVLWHGFITDITDAKKFELILTESEEKYRKLVNSAYDGIMVVNEDSIIEVANPQTHLMFGYNPGELLHKKFEILIPARFQSECRNLRKQYLESSTLREMGKGMAVIGLRKDSSEFHLDISLSPFTSNSRQLVNCVLRDTTHLREIENERAQILSREKSAREQAEIANRTKDEFLAILSHELRTPLTTILSWAQLLKKGTLDSSTSKNGIEILEQSAKAQGQLIDDLLDISRIQAGKMHLDLQMAGLSKIIWAAIDSTRGLWAKKSIRIEVEIAPEIKTIQVDPFRLQQILWNLITNAIKFSPEQSLIRVDVDTTFVNEIEMVRIQIRDKGKGVKAEFKEIMFNRFTQMDSSTTRLSGGLGLGLAIVKKLVELHRGFVEVESEGEGKGSNFLVYLPLNLLENETPQTDLVSSSKIESEPSLEGLKILLVDDDPSARHVFSITLESRGAVVKVAESAPAALVELNSFKPDILVSDIGMPKEDGYSLIRKIRISKSALSKIPAIALTAFASPGDIEKAKLAGFQVHVAKPVDGNKLVAEIAKLARDQNKD